MSLRLFDDTAVRIAIDEKEDDEPRIGVVRQHQHQHHTSPFGHQDDDDLFFDDYDDDAMMEDAMDHHHHPRPSSAALRPPEIPPMVDSGGAPRTERAYTVIARHGFQQTEYITIMSHLCKAEIAISFLFLVHGILCPGYPDQPAYQGTCHMNVVSAIFGILTGAIGIGAVHRYRWRTMLIMWLVMCIISAVGNLLSIINAGIWLDHLSKMKERTGFVNGLSGVMLLSAVAVGVCFILTAVMICHYWTSTSMKYQAIGRVSKRPVTRRRRNL